MPLLGWKKLKKIKEKKKTIIVDGMMLETIQVKSNV